MRMALEYFINDLWCFVHWILRPLCMVLLLVCCPYTFYLQILKVFIWYKAISGSGEGRARTWFTTLAGLLLSLHLTVISRSIKFLVAFLCCCFAFYEFSVGIGVCVLWLRQISSFFLSLCIFDSIKVNSSAVHTFKYWSIKKSHLPNVIYNNFVNFGHSSFSTLLHIDVVYDFRTYSLTSWFQQVLDDCNWNLFLVVCITFSNISAV